MICDICKEKITTGNYYRCSATTNYVMCGEDHSDKYIHVKCLNEVTK